MGLKVMALIMALGAVAMALFVLGVNGREARLGFRIMAAGIIMIYAEVTSPSAKARVILLSIL